MITPSQQDLIGHKAILEYLQNCLKNDSLSHAYLFLGPNGIGRMRLLEKFLPNLLASYTSAHPDVKIVSPLDNVITIDAVRELRKWLKLSALNAGAKIAVIDKAEAMNAEAQNAFLKILEEPEKKVYIFLLAGNRHQILPTIYSRAVPIYFNPVPKSEFENLKIWAENAHGRPGFLLAMDEYKTKHKDVIDKIIIAPDASERMRIWLEAKIVKEDIPEFLNQAVEPLRQKMLENNSLTLARALRNLHAALARPVAQNWQLAAENLIVSI